MSGKVRKWGNSLAIRIPRRLADELGIESGTPVEITRETDRIIVAPAAPSYTLDGLLKGVARKNLPGEVDMGPPQGKEVW